MKFLMMGAFVYLAGAFLFLDLGWFMSVDPETRLAALVIWAIASWSTWFIGNT